MCQFQVYSKLNQFHTHTHSHTYKYTHTYASIHFQIFFSYSLLQNTEFPVLQNRSLLVIYSREGNGTPLQYSCLENPMDGGAWQAAVHGVAESQTRLSDFPFTFHFHALEKEMATHSSVLAWKIPWMEEPGGLPDVYGVAQSRTRLKRLSSSSSSYLFCLQQCV